ncbi:T9SS type A sorting domain-containing protein [Owenweeksia hongkongensis]|uniref:T9SS type A sorting domain-containing protein n=1 Tax=Owenweeksia hongkongensis TaxID=253245 RepID=UPI003A9005C9
MKTSLFAGIVLMALSTSAQNLPQHPRIDFDSFTPREQAEFDKEISSKQRQNLNHKSTSGAVLSQRMSHADIAYYLFGSSLRLVYSPSAPDSTYTQVFTSPSKMETHGFGQVFDPTSGGFATTGQEHLSYNDPYQVDTIYVGVRYRTSSSISGLTGDTLKVAFFTADTNDNNAWRIGIGYGPGTYYGIGKRVEVLPPRFTGSSTPGEHGQIDAPNKVIIKYPLTAADTNANYLKIVPPSPLQVPAGHKVGVHCSFMPGQAFDPATQVYYRSGGKGDVNNLSWLYLTSKQSADNIPYFLESHNLSNNSAAISTVLFSGTRYHSWTGSSAFRNEYVSPTATNGNLIDFWVTGTSSVGLNETSKPNDISLYPNPSKGTVSFNLELSGDYTIRINNAVGATVHQEVLHLDSPTTIQRDLSTLTTGIYTIWIQHADEMYNGKWCKL